MSGPCPADFASMARGLGFSCADVKPVLHLRNPAYLENWTLPVVELLIVSLAIAAAVHAFRRWRAGDVTPAALWLGSVVYLLVMEPPVYFPAQFGIEDRLSIAFVHNVFTVEGVGGTLQLRPGDPALPAIPHRAGAYPSLGLGLLTFFDLVRFDVARGLRGGRWTFGVDVSRDFWSIL